MQIQQRIDGGDDTEDVISWIRSEFGDEAIARPSATGAGLIIWLVPALLFVVGLVVVIVVVRRGRTSGADV